MWVERWPLIESWTPPQSSHWCNRSLSHTYTLLHPLVHWTNDDNNRTVVRLVVIQAVHMEVFWQDETFWLTLPKQLPCIFALYPDEPQSNATFPGKLMRALCKVCKRYHCRRFGHTYSSFSWDAEHLLAPLPSLCSPSHPKPSQLGLGQVTVEASATLHHSPSWSNSPYTAWRCVWGHCPVE